MNKQELLKQADYTFQRGNRELAKKYLQEIIAAYPNDEAAWMLLARVLEEKERKIECFERVLKINPRNEEAKLGIVRVRASVSPTLPLPKQIRNQQKQKNGASRKLLRGALLTFLGFLLFGTTGYVIARSNPGSKVANIFALATPTVISNASLPEGYAELTRAEVNKTNPEYAPLVDALLGFAVANAGNGMEGAPERPGDRIIVSDELGMETKDMLAKSLPQPGSMTSVTITEQQITSWLVMELKNNPDLPLSEVQVYLRDGKVQIWGMVNGSDDSTSALVVGELAIAENKHPQVKIESMQIGQQVVPGALLAQLETWLNQSLSETINEQAPGLALVSVKVTSGLVTLSGTR
jgi:tetratricopeptide (TPR) repeat protein